MTDSKEQGADHRNEAEKNSPWPSDKQLWEACTISDKEASEGLKAAHKTMRAFVDEHLPAFQGAAYRAVKQMQAQRDNARQERNTAQSTVEQLQGRVARLEEVLKELGKYPMKRGDEMSAWSMRQVAREALADSSNWLQERLKQERERCAKVCEVIILDMPGHGRTAQTKPVAYPQPLYAAAIRALPEE